MSGHSHWAKIKRAKAGNDAKRGRVWSKLARRIIIAARSGGNPDDNLTLRYVIDEARAENMPNDTIDRAIKKGTGELGGVNYEQVLYEGYGPGGIAFLVDCLTDNRNRTAPELRKVFERGGGQLGANNCVAWMFEQKGLFVVAAEAANEDTLLEVALDAGADDVKTEGDLFTITCAIAAFTAVKQALERRKIPVISSEIAMVPKNTIHVDGETARKVLVLMELLEDHEDVQKVFANFDIDEDVLAQIQKGA